MVALDIDASVLKVAMTCSAILYAKFFCTTMIQGRYILFYEKKRYLFWQFVRFVGGKRFSGGTRPPEDATLSLAKKFKAKQTYGLEKSENPKHAEADIRWQRIVLNDLGEFRN
jgi:hypothetical protein